mmetsp:Transcript_13248/g.20700  ORF Transcript_13248/g.20700 Transcript_13248/m.20700 type:complete len:138 (-) Transcript_13248:3791-4204(-)
MEMPEFDHTERCEIFSQQQRMKKMNHKFVLFKNVATDPQGGKKSLNDGSTCPICQTASKKDADQDFQISSNFYMPKTFHTHIDMQNFQKLINMARFKAESQDIESSVAPPKSLISQFSDFVSGKQQADLDSAMKIRV